MESKPAIVWFRRDLRTADNPALIAACRHGSVVPVFISAPGEDERWAPGAASRWWLHHSLSALDNSLRAAGSRLIVRRGPTMDTLLALIRETGAGSVYWNRLYESAALKRDAQVKESLRKSGLQAESFNSALLHEPWTLKNRQGKPFQVFTPYWKTCQEQGESGRPAPEPRSIPSPARWPKSMNLRELALLPKIGWADGFSKVWNPGEAGARRKLKNFIEDALADYPKAREIPHEAGTSRLSPHLHFGEIGPRQVWSAIQDEARTSAPHVQSAAGAFLRQLGWREFAHHLLYHFPFTPARPLRAQFEKFPWARNAKFLKAWQKGQTGYPIIDAGMRELWSTGWMHNRVRMIVASFLVKDLLLSWTEGAAWFWDTLVDADLANNTLGWQWAGGCGADAAPYFRIFNPVLQGGKFDPDGTYVTRWIPELKALPAKWVHQPWEAPRDALRKTGYPPPLVDHGAARDRALEAFSFIRER